MSTPSVPIFILAGGYGTRISEETNLRPKPMIEIGNLPILLHIMRSYYAHGFNDFVICAGYRAFEIKSFFLTYGYHVGDLELDRRQSVDASPRVLGGGAGEKWRVRVLDTGLNTMTGGRLARAYDIVRAEEGFEHFGLTYGDGLSDINLANELSFHIEHGRLGTVLGVKSQARYGELDVSEGNRVTGFLEKPQSRQAFISGGFFFFRSDFRRYLSDGEDCVLEDKPLAKLAVDNELRVYKHDGFWHAMDTLRDKNHLQKLWDSGNAPWIAGNITSAQDWALTAKSSDRRARVRRAG